MREKKASPDRLALDRRIASALRPPHPFLEPFRRRVPADGGKRRRGELILLLGRLFGAPQGRLVPAAAAVEVVHLATLVHDDVVDGAERRRDRPTLDRVQGTAPALLYGDLLFARGIAAVNRLRNPELTDLLLATVSEICAGEILETRERGSFAWEEATYLEIIRLKTASLFEYCCLAPAILAGLPQKRRQVLRRLGRNLGLAYQIADDCLDFAAVPSRPGKDPLADLRNGVPNLPLLYAARDRQIGRELRRIPLTAARMKTIARLVREGGHLAAARKRGEGYEEKARRAARAVLQWSLAGDDTRFRRYFEL